MTQAFNLSQLANNLNTSGQLDATDGLVNAVPVTNGGTGASTVAAAVSNLSASIYPVGSIYINAGVTTNPATLLGFGTWTAFGAGRVLVGLNAGDSAFDTLQETGGSKDAIVVSHTHGVNITTASAGSHNHGYTGVQGTGYPDGANDSIGEGDVRSYVRQTQVLDAGIHTHSVSGTSDSTGSSATNANLQPYITVCMWLRTA
jgi:hypothetical protein